MPNQSAIKQRSRARRFMLFGVIWLSDILHDDDKAESIASPIIKARISAAITKASERVLAQGDMKLRLIGPVMDWAWSHKTITFSDESSSP